MSTFEDVKTSAVRASLNSAFASILPPSTEATTFTSTSGPGISLMTEFIGLAYFAEIPAVIINVQRGGPSTGMPTRTQQADLLACAYASNGDTKHVLLFPEDPRECFDFSAAALDLADRLQTPVFVMTDLDIGMNDWMCRPFEWDDTSRMDRGKVMTALLVLEAAAADAAVLDEVMHVSVRAGTETGSSAGLRPGDRVTVGELLYGLMLPSGNDAAVAFAEHFSNGWWVSAAWHAEIVVCAETNRDS